MFRKAAKPLTTSAEAYEYALGLLDRREHSEQELTEKLKRRGCPSAFIQETIEKLRSYDLINEERYARRVFETWRGKKIYGRLHLQAELAKKQVEDAYIRLLMQELSEEEERERVLAAYGQLQKRRDGKYDRATEKGTAALCRYLAARGFGAELIRVALEQARSDLQKREGQQ